MSDSKVTMQDIGKALKVSTVTVSKALNGKDGVSEEVRKKIIHTASRMGYRTKASMQKCSGSNRVAILIAEYCVQNSSSFYWNIYKDIVKSLKHRGYYAMLELVRKEDEINGTIPDFITEGQVESVFILGWLGKTYLTHLAATCLPLICVDFFFNAPNSTAVITDMIYDTYKITELLYEYGHRKIGFVGSIHASSSIQDKYLGYYKCLIRRNLSTKDEWILEDRNNIDDRVLKRKFLLPKDMPTAFVCNSDETAYAFIKYLLEKGYQVPDDVSVVGYYNNEYALTCTPELTTIEVNRKHIAESAVVAGCNLMWKTAAVTDMSLASGCIINRKSVKMISNIT